MFPVTKGPGNWMPTAVRQGLEWIKLEKVKKWKLTNLQLYSNPRHDRQLDIWYIWRVLCCISWTDPEDCQKHKCDTCDLQKCKQLCYWGWKTCFLRHISKVGIRIPDMSGIIMIQTVWLKRVRFLDDMNKMAAILFKKLTVPVSSMGIFALSATYFGYTYLCMWNTREN